MKSKDRIFQVFMQVVKIWWFRCCDYLQCKVKKITNKLLCWADKLSKSIRCNLSICWLFYIRNTLKIRWSGYFLGALLKMWEKWTGNYDTHGPVTMVQSTCPDWTCWVSEAPKITTGKNFVCETWWWWCHGLCSVCWSVLGQLNII